MLSTMSIKPHTSLINPLRVCSALFQYFQERFQAINTKQSKVNLSKNSFCQWERKGKSHAISLTCSWLKTECLFLRLSPRLMKIRIHTFSSMFPDVWLIRILPWHYFNWYFKEEDGQTEPSLHLFTTSKRWYAEYGEQSIHLGLNLAISFTIY